MIKQFTIFFLILSCVCFSQTDKKGTIKVKKVEADTVPLALVEKIAEFPGGNAAFNKYVSLNMTYPQKEKEDGISGTAYFSFVVELDGSITNVTLLRGVPRGSGCDKEAMRVLSAMPKWSPALKDGKAVKVRMMFPIKFNLQ
ncbi:hypothetical protein BH10BAC1_BH10BAC1_15400 [soil metagenome]